MVKCNGFDNGKSALWALLSLLAAVISLTSCTGTTSSIAPNNASSLANSSSLRVTNSTLPSGAVQTAYMAALTATGGTPPYSWSVSDGDLPPSLSLNSTDGTLSGTPTAPGTFSFMANLQDSDGLSASAQFSLSVSDSAMPTTSSGDGLSGAGTTPPSGSSPTSTPPSQAQSPQSGLGDGSGSTSATSSSDGSPSAGTTPSAPSSPTSTPPSQTQSPQPAAENSTGSTTSVGSLSLSVQSLSFGSVNVGASQSQTVVVSNSGSANVTISNVSVSGPGVACRGADHWTRFGSSTTATIYVTFAPAAAGSVTGSVVITSDAANSTTLFTVSGTGVQAAASHAVELTWSPSTSIDVAGYDVYRGLTSDGPYTMLTTTAATNYTDTNVQAGQTYYYVLTAVDSSNVQSAFSTIASATIP